MSDWLEYAKLHFDRDDDYSLECDVKDAKKIAAKVERLHTEIERLHTEIERLQARITELETE